MLVNRQDVCLPGPSRLSVVVGSTRRLLAQRLAAAPLALLLAATLPDAAQRAEAKKKSKSKSKNKNRKSKGKKRKQKNSSGNSAKGGSYSPDNEERAFLDLINRYRRDKGLSSLSLNDQLGAAAEYHSRDMAQKDYFKHTLSNGDSPEENIVAHGYRDYRFVGENIAAGFAAADDAFDAWKGSPEHDKNMLSKNFTEIGIGRAPSTKGKYDWYWTTTFGSR